MDEREENDGENDIEWLEKVFRLRKQEPLEGSDYYSISKFADDGCTVTTSCTTQWCGFTETIPKREIREGRKIYPRETLKDFEIMKQPALLVSTLDDLFFYFYFGGYAIVEATLAKQFFGDLLDPHEVFRDSSGFGYVLTDAADEEQLRHAPTRKLRMLVLNRDNRRCAICGRSPFHHTDLELEVHHIIPWNNGGITEKDNLVTLCNTCHAGLTPHYDLSLKQHVPGSRLLIDSDYIER